MFTNMRGKNTPAAGAVLVYILLVISYFVSYFFRVSTAILLPSLAEEWHISAATVGVISSIYFYTYGAAQPLSGALNDRFGPTRVIAFALAFTGVGALLMGFSQSPLLFTLGRAITGLGLAPMLSGVLAFQSSAFSISLYTTLSGITYTVGNFGSVVSVGPLDRAIDRWGRSAVFVVLTLGSLVVAAALLANVRRDAVLARSRSPRSRASVFRNLAEAFKTVSRSSQLKYMLIIWCVYFGSLMAFQGLWAVSWYREAFGISQAEASAWATLIGFGVMGGSLVGGYLWRQAKSRRTALVVSYIAYTATWVALWLSLFFALSIELTGILGFLMGFMSGVCSDHLTAGVNDLAEPGRGASLFGCTNLLVYIAIILYQSLSGLVLARYPAGLPGRYTPRGYLVTFGIVVGVMLASQLALLGLRSFDKQESTGEVATTRI